MNVWSYDFTPPYIMDLPLLYMLHCVGLRMDVLACVCWCAMQRIMNNNSTSITIAHA